MATHRPLLLHIHDESTGARARHAFLRSPVRIGRAPDGDVALDAPFVSGRHGILQFDAEEIRYTDLGSRNGSAVDGRPLAPEVPAPLAPGAVIAIGSLRLRVEWGEAPPAAEQEEAVAPGALTALLERLARPPALGAAEVASHGLWPGMTIGRFELVRELGRGGFGVVFEAQDQRLGRRVALKVMRPGARRAGLGGDWLHREAEAAAQLNHPNIVSLHDVGEWEGGPYLVLELLRGEPLDERLARGGLTLAEALAVAIDVARAMAHAHAAGVVHRDLKPSNVFLAQDGFAKVLDFGLAHVFGAGAAPAGGTPRYMAPEQRRGEPTDPRTDVFAAALLLHETLAGPLPGGDAIPEAGPYPGTPESLPALVARALSPAPEHRPPGGRAWLDALLAVQREASRDAWPH